RLADRARPSRRAALLRRARHARHPRPGERGAALRRGAARCVAGTGRLCGDRRGAARPRALSLAPPAFRHPRSGAILRLAGGDTTHRGAQRLRRTRTGANLLVVMPTSILVVDDDLGVCRALGRELTRRSYRVLIAHDVEDAFRQLIDN